MQNTRKAIKKAQSVFMQAVVFPAMEDCRQQFAQLERVPYMPEIVEADHGEDLAFSADYAGIWEGR